MLESRPEFHISVPGKWILAGEHSVLRGGEALVFPLFSKFINLSYFSENFDFDIEICGQNKIELEMIIWSVLERALKNLGLKRSLLHGRVKIESSIALGGGMGASATLCAALTELFFHLKYVEEANKFNFARNLENIFHGESSGVDVAVTLCRKPLIFKRDEGFRDLIVKTQNKPQLYLSFSGEKGVTKDCVEKVKGLFLATEESKLKAIETDKQMQMCVEKFKILLEETELNLIEWIKVMKLANSCFENWGLITKSVRSHQNKLLDLGALATKLTGSGGGGYVLSLWETEPPEGLREEMIACFSNKYHAS